MRCTAKTRAGRRCKRKARLHDVCAQHHPLMGTQWSRPKQAAIAASMKGIVPMRWIGREEAERLYPPHAFYLGFDEEMAK